MEHHTHNVGTEEQPRVFRKQWWTRCCELGCGYYIRVADVPSFQYRKLWQKLPAALKKNHGSGKRKQLSFRGRR